MTIKQLNATYDREEDRILLKITVETLEKSTHEYRFWFTRANTLWLMAQVDQRIISSLKNHHHSPAQAEEIANFQQEALAEASNFNADFEEAPVRPLGDVPQLVHQLQIGWESDQCTLILQLQNKSHITITLTDQLMSQTKLLLQKICTQAKWIEVLHLLTPTIIH
ncbi:hypothetical protein [Limnohabitans sp. Jir72]|uniref:hypothetical protein n=1 Tax=Limnohabitans sp. Jir72 TaxID=1977909 RepID=UPI0011B1E666|nr:hypothetical protein [Limnohabitans sp. Jir72]